MNILIPVDIKDRYKSIIKSIEENSFWALVCLEDAKIVNVSFYERKEDIDVFIDNLVVINNMEFVWPFFEESINIFIAPIQKSIDEIVEAFLFNELKPFSKKE